MAKQTADLGKPTLLQDKLEHGKTQSIRFYQPQIDATRAFIANHPENQFENLTQFYAYLLETASKPAQTTPANDTVIKNAYNEALHTEIESLRQQLQTANETIEQLKAAQPTENAPATATGLEILDTHPRLSWFKNFVTEKTQNIGDVLLAHRAQSEAAIHQLMLDPMQILEPEDFETLKKWDAEVFVPTLVKRIPQDMLDAYGIENLAQYLNGAHKFMMMWDFCLNDPAEHLLNMGLNLSDEQKEYIANLGFPRMEIVERCMEDISNHKRKLIEQLEKETPADVTTQLALEEETTTGAEAGATIIDINRGAATPAATNDKTDNDHGN